VTLQLRISAWLGIAFGVFLVCGETLRNWGAWGYWASYAFDYLFAALLLLFGRMTLAGARWAHVMLIATWALTATLFTYSLVGHLREIDEATYGLIPQFELTIAIGILDLIAVTSLALAIYSLFVERSNRATQVLT
jgi:hypothetical protein